ncbi:STAS domain-containing protein [Streptomyces sp. CC224B]|uniref:STAS domain-containing protein n=1 Tax=Streptomyces sp. CC224B TaxID=3044571 RepID=UPI0024A83DC1|nr:STAS domain-containing protein [Streptomyces sp. CC224B]
MDRLVVRPAPCDDSAFLTLVLVGELEVVNVGKLSDAAVWAFAQGQRHLLLDMRGVTQCDTGSLYTILGIRQAASHVGGSLAITQASTAVHESLAGSDLRELLETTPP